MPHDDHTQLYHLFVLAGLDRRTPSAPAPEQIAPLLTANAVLHTVPPGTKLNLPCPRYGVQLVLQGRFQVWRTNAKGIPNIIASHQAPELIGIAQVLLEQTESVAWLCTTTECTYVQIDPDYFLQCMEQDGALALLVTRNLLRKQQLAQARAEDLICNSTRDNLLLYLYREWKRQEAAARTRPHRSFAFSVPMDHTQMAAQLGVCTRTLGRAMRTLREQGWLNVQGRRILFSAEQLERLEAHCSGLHNGVWPVPFDIL